MAQQHLQPAGEPDYVEPELISNGPRESSEQARRPFEGGFPPPPPAAPPGLLARVRGVAALITGVGGVILLLLGLLLTTTVIGAIIGIPLMLAGMALLALAMRLVVSGSKNAFIFRKFP